MAKYNLAVLETSDQGRLSVFSSMVTGRHILSSKHSSSFCVLLIDTAVSPGLKEF